MSYIDTLLSDLDKISEQLLFLSDMYQDAFEEVNGSDFPEQSILAGVYLDNLISESTDLLALYIKGKQKEVRDLVAFIEFRRRHKHFSDMELVGIIDHGDKYLIDSKEKISPTENLEILHNLNEIRKEWNIQFDNRSYKNLRGRITRSN